MVWVIFAEDGGFVAHGMEMEREGKGERGEYRVLLLSVVRVRREEGRRGRSEPADL